MSRREQFWVITSNHLIEGDAIWLNNSGDWTRKLGEAKLFDDRDSAETALMTADKERHIHVGAYLAAARPGRDQKPEPQHVREQIRTTGPSNYFHGKQATASDVSV